MRYEGVFAANVLCRRRAEKERANAKPAMLSPLAARKTRQAAGWRGLSVDLITNPGEHPLRASEDVKGKSLAEEDNTEEELVVGPGEKLDGRVVRNIWGESKLEKGKLKNIWCADPVMPQVILGPDLTSNLPHFTSQERMRYEG